MAAKELWIRADRSNDPAVRKDLVIEALESGITTAIVRPEDKDFASLGKLTLIYSDKGKLTDGIALVELRKPTDQDAALALAGKVKTVILGTSDWTVIPLENMIARFRGTGTRVFACASDPAQAKVYATTLEKGADGIVIDTADGNAVRQFAQNFASVGQVELTTLEVLDARPVEIGDRVCVDTVSVMHPGEGMLIGSQAACLFLVQSESEDNGYVAARPFRVNAGAVHAYVMGPEGKTRYLAELRSGDELVLVDSHGKTRPSCVGRCKIEQRPLILVEAADDQHRYTTILQNAETVKLVGPDGSHSVTSLKKGDKVLAKVEAGGRHFGMKIDETIREV
ncbi:MAG: 3-dehydroquinate synthase II [Candidatus Methanomethylophilus sp.]|nr:3-dehydroquinate synthase II [Methanomethylophilus sp.]MDD3232571.1 3-dehydroquinate synthase II [Methanomethylophilus sp.]MDD4221620.1 3-dehydroquinate synthase II [Methanomethylophilus sp.]